MSESDDVAEFHRKINEEVGTAPHLLDEQTMGQRLNFMQEELDEIKAAFGEGRLDLVFDGLIDLVYVAKGTAVMMGLPWADGWRLVQAANMAKEPGRTSRGMVHDAVKPPGWQPPDLARLLGRLG